MPKRVIRGKDFLTDIRSGMTDHALRKKYSLSSKSLHKVFKKLVLAKAIKPGKRSGRVRVLGQDIAEVIRNRQSVREFLGHAVPLFEVKALRNFGLVRDISETGVGAIGIEATPGDSKELLISAHVMFPVDTFSFEAICRWSENVGPGGLKESGFEITNISEEAADHLRQLMYLVKLEGSRGGSPKRSTNKV